ncbi:Cytochrome P450 4C1 [Blattella germanica]|nr:Cytochrome P450 4C1 [Blattella germanica]
MCLIVFQYWWPRRRLYELASKIPGPVSYPIVGNAHTFCLDSKLFYQKLCKTLDEYSPICRLWLGQMLFVFLSEPKDLEVILGNPKLIYKSKLYRVLEELYGNGLITNGGKMWRKHRKIITPTFHFNILEQFLEIFNRNSRVLVHKLRNVSGDEPINPFPHLALCTLDMISQTAMGIDIDAQNNSETEFVKAVEVELRTGHERFLKPWLWNYFIFRWTKLGRDHVVAEKIVREFTNNIIAKKINVKTMIDFMLAEEEEVKKRSAFLDLMIEKKQLEDSEMRDEAFTLLVAGHDTTANTNCFILTLIGLHPEVQEQIQLELDRIFPDNTDRPVTTKDLKNMTYLDMVIKESLRLFPAAPVVARDLVEEMVVGGHRLPAGCSVAFNLHKTHRNPTWFPNPELFDPERFRPGQSKKWHPFCYLPFGAGPRNCVGQKYAQLQMKTVISTVLRNFHVKSATTREELDNLKIDIVIRPINGVRLKFIPRK